MELEYVSTREAAEILGVDRKTIIKMIEAGKLRAKDTNTSNGIRKRWKVFKQDLMPDNA